jgi:Domain of unknown function (DUF4388)
LSTGPGTTQPEIPPAVREAVYEFQRYLSDDLAPMMAVDAVEMLLQIPAPYMASTIQAWIGGQFRGQGANVAVSDYLFHAFKKLHQMMEYELIDRSALAPFLVELEALLIEMCPEADQSFLRNNLARVEEAVGTSTVAPVQNLHRQAGGSATQSQSAPMASAPAPAAASGPGAVVPVEMAHGMRRFSLLLDRLAHVPVGPGGAEIAPALAAAAAKARTDEEFERSIGELRSVGVDASMDKVFQQLCRAIPGWSVSTAAPDGKPLALPESQSVKAMHRIISMAQSPEEGAKRFDEMLQAAVEQFNSGSLARAAAMIDLARRIVDEQRIKPESLEAIRRRAQDALAVEQLREHADKPEKHELLRRVLTFFPAYTARGLLAALYNEPRRDKRRLCLSLLEAHGPEAREASLDKLAEFGENPAADPHGYYMRNLVYLMRRIAPPGGTHSDREVGLLLGLTAWSQPMLIVREAVASLGSVKHDKAEELLIARLQEAEQMLAHGQAQGKDPSDLQGALDWIVSALARRGTSDARRAVVDHAFERHPALGDTLARIEELQSQDLGDDRPLVDRLVRALRGELPSRVLGLVVGKNPKAATHLIRALSHTSAPEVRQLLEEIGQRYAGQPIGAEATKAIATLGAASRATKDEASTSLTGDVELFGLPNLLQSLADSRVTGVLTLSDRECETIGTLGFVDGQVVSGQVGPLSGEAAFYQLFEKPIPGNFVFRRRGEVAASCEPFEVMPAILESLRRYDEFQVAHAVAPDDGTYRTTDRKPVPLADETDLALTRTVWLKASSGATPGQVEREIAVDAFRVRRLYAHWLEAGCLAPR